MRNEYSFSDTAIGKFVMRVLTGVEMEGSKVRTDVAADTLLDLAPKTRTQVTRQLGTTPGQVAAKIAEDAPEEI